MFKWLWHRILYGAYPTKFDKRVHTMYKQGVMDGITEEQERNMTGFKISEKLEEGISKCFQRELAMFSANLDSVLESFSVQLDNALHDATKEGVYRGAEEGLKHAIEQIIEVMNVESIYEMWKEKHNG